MADFNMNLLAQMLMGGGASMYQGKGLTGAAAVGMQQMGAQSMRNTLRKLLSGLPEGGKLAMTSGGPVGDNGGTVNLSLPMTSMADTPQSVQGALAPTESNIATPTRSVGGGGLGEADLGNILKLILGGGGNAEGRWPNPPSSPLDVSNADLVGLTPENVVQALHGRQTQEELGLRGQNLELQRAQHALDIPYKMAQIQHLMRGESADQPFPVQVPGVGTVTNKQWAELPVPQREYALYVNTATKLGAAVKSFEDYQLMKPTDKEKFLRAAMQDKDLMKAAVDLAHAGATNIDLSVGKKQAMNELEGETFFSKPWSEHIDKYMGTEEAKDRIDRLTQTILEKEGKANLKGKESVAPRNDAMRRARAKTQAEWVDEYIRTGHGEVIGNPVFNKQSGVMTWNVRWPSGKVMKIQRKITD